MIPLLDQLLQHERDEREAKIKPAERSPLSGHSNTTSLVCTALLLWSFSVSRLRQRMRWTPNRMAQILGLSVERLRAGNIEDALFQDTKDQDGAGVSHTVVKAEYSSISSWAITPHRQEGSDSQPIQSLCMESWKTTQSVGAGALASATWPDWPSHGVQNCSLQGSSKISVDAAGTAYESRYTTHNFKPTERPLSHTNTAHDGERLDQITTDLDEAEQVDKSRHSSEDKWRPSSRHRSALMARRLTSGILQVLEMYERAEKRAFSHKSPGHENTERQSPLPTWRHDLATALAVYLRQSHEHREDCSESQLFHVLGDLSGDRIWSLSARLSELLVPRNQGLRSQGEVRSVHSAFTNNIVSGGQVHFGHSFVSHTHHEYIININL